VRSRNVSLRWISYELRNILGNPFVHVFGVIFPSLITIMVAKAVTSDMADPVYIKQIMTGIFLGNGSIIPLAILLMGYASLYSQEIEKKIPERMRLFGCSERCTVCNRLIAETIQFVMAYAIYFAVNMSVLTIARPSVRGVVIYFVISYIFAVILFLLSHAIAGLAKKFGVTFFISMFLYFGIIILSGLMGINKEQLPKGIQMISNLLPTSYMGNEFYDVWVGNSYRFASMIQAFLFFGAVTGILLIAFLYKNRRRLH